MRDRCAPRDGGRNGLRKDFEAWEQEIENTGVHNSNSTRLANKTPERLAHSPY